MVRQSEESKQSKLLLFDASNHKPYDGVLGSLLMQLAELGIDWTKNHHVAQNVPTARVANTTLTL